MLFWLTFERSCLIQESSSPLQNAVTVPSYPFLFLFLLNVILHSIIVKLLEEYGVDRA